MQDIILGFGALVVSAVVIIICRYLVPWIKTKFSKETVEFISIWVAEAVKAAEQTHGDGEGRVKKEEVLKFVHQALENYGINLSEEAIDVLIEAAVKQLKIELLLASPES